MPRSAPALSALNSGELSPRLEGRIDYEQYPKGLRKCENFLPLVQGPVIKRSGTIFITSTKDSAKRSRLFKAKFRSNQANILEFGDTYIRFYANHGQVFLGAAVYEIVTPYLEADLATLKITQSNDVIYISHRNYAPRTLSRLAVDNWALAIITFKNGPFAPRNETTTITVQASAQTGAVTLQASADIFEVGHVGGLFSLEHLDTGSVKAWEAGKAILINAICRYRSNYYKAVAAATTGGDPPVHTEGKAFDGNTGVEWEYQHSGVGWATITAFTDANTVSATVVSLFPAGVVSTATWKWSFGEWSTKRGYPGVVTFYGSRLFWLSSPSRPQTAWGSVTGDYLNHKAGTTDDAALIFTLDSDDVQEIKWAIGDEKGLLIGTESGEWVVRPSSQNEALTPLNIKATQSTSEGSSEIPPTRAGKAVLYVQRALRKIHEFAYLLEDDGFRSPDMTIRSDHISKTGFVDMSYEAQPESIIWLPRADGQLCSFTYKREQDAVAWARHILGGYSDAGHEQGPVVESVATIPSPDGARDETWLIVRRHINGQSVRQIEYFSPLFSYEVEQEDGHFVDCGLVYDGVPATVFSGLGHLEGQEVAVLADGATHPNVTVVGGSVTLEREASVVHIGLSFTATLQTERLEAGTPAGFTAQGAVKRIMKLMMRFWRTLGAKFGPDEANLDEVTFHEADETMDTAPLLFDGDKVERWPGGYDTDGCMTLVSDTPTPMMLLMLVPEMVTEGRPK